jgi:hypothetical protein
MKMKQNYVKQLRTLLEGEIEQAEVIIAAKGFAQELQDMIEKVGRLMNEDLGPVVDQMREAHGNDVSANFGGMMSTQLQEVIDELRVSKEKIDDAVDSIASGGVPSNDMDVAGDDFGGDELGLDAELDMEDDLDAELSDDELGMEDDLEMDIEEPLGRAAKESKEEELRNKIRVMEERLAKAKA